MADRNFSVKWTLSDANTVKITLQRRLAKMIENIDHLSDEDKEEAGRIETILRRDF
jgi:hypothetical protein